MPLGHFDVIVEEKYQLDHRSMDSSILGSVHYRQNSRELEQVFAIVCPDTLGPISQKPCSSARKNMLF